MGVVDRSAIQRNDRKAINDYPTVTFPPIPSELSSRSVRSRGTVLIIVLIAMTLLALSAYTFANLMLDHRRAIQAGNMRAQSDATVASAVDAIRAFLMQPPLVQQQMGGTYDNPEFFAFQSVVEDPSPSFRSQFSVVSTELGEQNAPSIVRYGLIDESSKLNLNHLVAKEQDPSATTLTLLALPGMTADIADAILDWIDADVEKREYGAEFAEDYASMQPPRAPADGPIHSLSELLLVRGVTAELLYGMDFNRNGIVDDNEAQLAAGLEGLTGSAGESTVAGSMELGWSAYLTCYGRERNVDPEGNYRINVNQDDLQSLHEQITAVSDEDTATFICAYRQFGPAEVVDPANGQVAGAAGGPSTATFGPVAGRTIDLTQPADFDIKSVADLIDAVVEAQFESAAGGPPASSGVGELVQSPFVIGEVPELLPYLSVTDERAIAGRINVNQATRPVLSTITDLPTEAIDQILATRGQRNASDGGRTHPIWILNDEIVDLETMREVLPYLTAGGDVYSADIVASTGDGNAVRRVQVLLDATRPEVPQLVWKDKDFLGRGYAREMLVNPDTANHAMEP